MDPLLARVYGIVLAAFLEVRLFEDSRPVCVTIGVFAALPLLALGAEAVAKQMEKEGSRASALVALGLFGWLPGAVIAFLASLVGFFSGLKWLSDVAFSLVYLVPATWLMLFAIASTRIYPKWPYRVLDLLLLIMILAIATPLIGIARS